MRSHREGGWRKRRKMAYLSTLAYCTTHPVYYSILSPDDGGHLLEGQGEFLIPEWIRTTGSCCSLCGFSKCYLNIR